MQTQAQNFLVEDGSSELLESDASTLFMNSMVKFNQGPAYTDESSFSDSNDNRIKNILPDIKKRKSQGQGIKQ